MYHMPETWERRCFTWGMPFVCLLGSLPLLALIVWGVMERLGANPPETVLHATGLWALRLLLITLALGPLHRLTGWDWFIRPRRVVALFAFFYACLHGMAYLLFESGFAWSEMCRDFAKRPHLWAGLGSFLAMLPLAITSSAAMVRWLGARIWRRLHRLAYLSALLAVFHYIWLVKWDITAPGLYALILLALLALRLIPHPRSEHRVGERAAPSGRHNAGDR